MGINEFAGQVTRIVNFLAPVSVNWSIVLF
jgi:hypothetical protein